MVLLAGTTRRTLGSFTPGGRGDGRPIWVTDLRNPTRPVVFSEPIDLWRNDGLTDYSHDVDVDDEGIAWTSGRGGLLGYATQGRWRDPRTNEMRNARPWDPILVAGGGIEGGPDGVAQPQTDFIHNAARPLSGEISASGVPDGNVVIMTEEDFTGPCSASGRIIAADITASLGGEPATNSTPASPFRMDALSAYHPTQDGIGTVGPSASCSAHYFEISGSTVAAGWYGQGLRLIDASDARNLRQVGYYYVTGTDAVTNPSSLSWDVAWNGDLIYLFDMSRGVEILRLADGPSASRMLPTVQEPAPAVDPLAAQPVVRPDARVARMPRVRHPRPGLSVRGEWAVRPPAPPCSWAGPMSGVREGGCACGAVRYRLASDPLFVHCCHCLNCQRQTGSAFVINLLIETDRVELLAADPVPVDVPSRPEDDAANLPLPDLPGRGLQPLHASKHAVRPRRTLDDPSSIAPDVHIYTRSKLPWVTLPESVPAFSTYYDPEKLWPPRASSASRR